jgi:Ca-activated chloride channel family protein
MGNYNDILMEKLGNKGNGSYAYVDDIAEARRIFVDNLTGNLQVIARDVKIQVDFDPRFVRSYRLLGYENRDVEDAKFRDDKEDGGEIGAGHSVTALYEIKLRAQRTDDRHGNIGTIYIRHKNPDDFEVTENSFGIDRSVFARTFNSCSPQFRLAAAAAEFAEILRKSYWAKGSSLENVLAVVKNVNRDWENDDVLEMMHLVSKAAKIQSAVAEK